MNILFFLTPKNEVSYIYDDCNLKIAADDMEKSGFSAVPVINKDGNYIGTMGEGDVLKALKEKIKNNDTVYDDIKVKDIILKKNDMISINANIEDLVLKSLEQNFIPVIDDNNIFIGIVTRKNIIQYCYNTYVKGENLD